MLVSRIEEATLSYLSSMAGRANSGGSRELLNTDEQRAYEANHASARRKVNQMLWRDIMLDLDQFVPVHSDTRRPRSRSSERRRLVNEMIENIFARASDRGTNVGR